jgi:hypothetical protein
MIYKDISGVYPAKIEHMIVPTGERRSVYIHALLDLVVHEIQSDETDFALGVTPGVKQATGHAVGDAGQGLARLMDTTEAVAGDAA